MACAPETGTPLIDAAAWQEDRSRDPVPEHRQGERACDPLGLLQELGGFEVETDRCPYAVFTQPLLADVRAQRPMGLLLWHNDLVNGEPAEGHLLLTVGDAVLFDWTEPIPSDAAVIDDTVTLDAALRAGDVIVLHLHNHGANSWNVNSLSLKD